MTKRVRVAITFERLIEVSDDYDEGMVQFYMNDSSHCLISELRDEVWEHDENGFCTLCARASARVVNMNPPPEEPEE